MAIGEYRLDDVQVQRNTLIIKGIPVGWWTIADVRIESLATGRSLAWAIVRLVPAIPLFLYGVSYVFYASFAAPYRFAEWTVLATGLIFALPGVLLGGRPIVTCWQFGRYALIIKVAAPGWEKPIEIRSRRRLALESRERQINAMRDREFTGQQINTNIHLGDINTTHGPYSPITTTRSSPSGEQAAIQELLQAVQAMRSQVSGAPQQAADEFLQLAGAQLQKHEIREALAKIRRAATRAGQVGVPVIQAIQKVSQALNL